MADCPKCQTRMRSVVEQEVAVDVCDDCHCVWLDPGELNALTRSSDFQPGRAGVEIRRGLTCPRCRQGSFKDIVTGEGTFCRCGDCGGVLVSGATLDALSESGNTKSAAQSIADTCSLPTEIANLVAEVLRFFSSQSG